MIDIKINRALQSYVLYEKDVLQILSTEIWFTNQKTSISVDSSRVSLCISGFISNEEIHA